MLQDQIHLVSMSESTTMSQILKLCAGTTQPCCAERQWMEAYVDSIIQRYAPFSIPFTHGINHIHNLMSQVGVYSQLHPRRFHPISLRDARVAQPCVSPSSTAPFDDIVVRNPAGTAEY